MLRYANVQNESKSIHIPTVGFDLPANEAVRLLSQQHKRRWRKGGPITNSREEAKSSERQQCHGEIFWESGICLVRTVRNFKHELKGVIKGGKIYDEAHTINVFCHRTTVTPSSLTKEFV